jgi:hypothetical protein
VVLGGGYVLLGARAHRSPPVVHATRAASPPTSSATLAKALVPAFGVATGRGRRARPPRVSKPASPARGSRSVGPASSREFLPESLPHEQAGAAPTSIPAPTSSLASASRPASSSLAPTRTPGAEGEFGIE